MSTSSLSLASFVLGALVTSSACGDSATEGQPEAADALPPIASRLPAALSETGYFLVARPENAFTPRFMLWTDGAQKDRHIFIPAGAIIDDSDVDNWQLPVGTRVFKTFSKAGRKLETRVMMRGASGWLAGAYIWNEAGSDARLAAAGGESDIDETGHDVPGMLACQMCHGAGAGAAEGAVQVLGFSAIQLAHDAAGLTVSRLRDAGKLVHSPAVLQLPGDDLDRAVLGWLHVNCGACHADNASMADHPMRLRLTADTLATVEGTPAVATTVDKTSLYYADMFGSLIASGDPDHSLIYARITSRGDFQMPPLGTEHVDEAGAALLRAWIERRAP